MKIPIVSRQCWTNFQSAQLAFAPAVPQTYEELGIQSTIVLDLMLRRMLMDGFSTLQRLSQCLKLSMGCAT